MSQLALLYRLVQQGRIAHGWSGGWFHVLPREAHALYERPAHLDTQDTILVRRFRGSTVLGSSKEKT